MFAYDLWATESGETHNKMVENYQGNSNIKRKKIHKFFDAKATTINPPIEHHNCVSKYSKPSLMSRILDPDEIKTSDLITTQKAQGRGLRKKKSTRKEQRIS